MKPWTLALPAIFLTAISCAPKPITVLVNGKFEDNPEVLTGTATGYRDGSGTIELKSAKGLVCTGAFVHITPREGAGTLSANDGRSGKFRFVTTGERGTGTGDLAGRKFIFTFGPPPEPPE